MLAAQMLAAEVTTLQGLVLANYEWNVFLRGILFPLIMFVILCGSSYLILATNMGNRLGFLIAATGLVGWMFLMSIVWMLYGIGLQGRPPAWGVEEVITQQQKLEFAQHRPVGLLAGAEFQSGWCPTETDVKAVKGDDEKEVALAKLEANAAKTRQAFKKKQGWEPMCEGTSQRGDGQSTVDATLVKSKKNPLKTPRAIFSEAANYKTIGAYRRGGDNDLFTIGSHPVHLRHSAHYFVILVQPVQTKTIKEPVYGPGRVQEKTADGQPKFTEVAEVLKGPDGSVLVDKTKPVTSVVMLRDQGSKRQPPFILFIFSGIGLAILASILHARDKQVMAAMGKPYKSAKLTALKA